MGISLKKEELNAQMNDINMSLQIVSNQIQNLYGKLAEMQKEKDTAE